MGGSLGSWFPGGSPLTAGDWVVFAAALAVFVALGRRAEARARGVDGFHRAGRSAPWWLAGLALVSAEVSALTVLGVPSTAFREDWTFLQVFLGAAAARVLVAFLFAPALFGGGATVYGWLGERFGPRTRATAAALFVLSRLLACAVRLLACAVAAGALLGWGLPPALVLLTAVAALALARGGAPAAVETGAFQAAAILGVGVLCAVFLLRRVDGGIGAALSLAAEAGKTRVLDFGPAPWAPGFLARFFGDASAFWPSVLTGFFGSAAAFGTDHELAQKLMCVRDAREGRKAMLASIAGSLAVLLVYLLVGTLLFVFYKQNPGMALPDRLERIFPHFAATAMRPLLRGAALAAIVLASIDLPLASLASVFAADLRAPLAPAGASELDAARTAALAFAAILAGLTLVLGGSEPALRVALKAGGATAGPVLGVYALGLLTRRGGDASALGALAGACALDLGLLALEELGFLPVGWGWLVMLGALAAFGLGWGFGRPAPRGS